MADSLGGRGACAGSGCGCRQGVVARAAAYAGCRGGEEGGATLDESGHRQGSLVGVELAVGEPGVVVDKRVHELVADPHPLLSARQCRSPVRAWPGRLKRAERLVSTWSRSPGQGHAYRRTASRLPRSWEIPARRSVRQTVACAWPVSPAIRRGPQPERRLAAQIRSCSLAANSRGSDAAARHDPRDKQAKRALHAEHATSGATTCRQSLAKHHDVVAAALHEQPASISATKQRRPASPSRALR